MIDWSLKIYFNSGSYCHDAKLMGVDKSRGIYYVSNGDLHNDIQYHEDGTWIEGTGMRFYNLTNDHPRNGREPAESLPMNFLPEVKLEPLPDIIDPIENQGVF